MNSSALARQTKLRALGLISYAAANKINNMIYYFTTVWGKAWAS